MGGGAWPFLVGGVICLVYSDNERDLSLLNSGYVTLSGEVCWTAAPLTGGRRLACGSLSKRSYLLRKTTYGKWVEA